MALCFYCKQHRRFTLRSVYPNADRDRLLQLAKTQKTAPCPYCEVECNACGISLRTSSKA